MIAVHCFSGKKVAIFGLGGSGLATAHALIAGGADVIAWDDNPKSVELARAENIPCADLAAVDFADIAAFILAPGVPLTHPKPHWSVEKAKAAGVEIIGDIELFVRERNAYLKANGLHSEEMPFIAITGTNGKSTTTALIAYLLQCAGKDVQMGGNIGTSILSLETFAPGRFYVIECSSFQIDLTPSINPTVGILLNITPDHIDRHGNFSHYAEIKERLVAGAGLALVGVDDDACRLIFERLTEKGKNIFAIAKSRSLQTGYFSKGTELFFAEEGHVTKLADLDGVTSLRGDHNAQNALMALGVLGGLHITSADLRADLIHFQGLPHRMQQVRKIGHTLFINDSKATNAEASAPALASFEHIYWIIGGLAKEGGIETLKSFFPKIRKAYIIGDAAEQFAKTIGDAFPVSMSGTLENAVKEAAHDAEEANIAEAAVLLSPACASYDQFLNYGARGDAFIALVNAL